MSLLRYWYAKTCSQTLTTPLLVTDPCVLCATWEQTGSISAGTTYMAVFDQLIIDSLLNVPNACYFLCFIDLIRTLGRLIPSVKWTQPAVLSKLSCCMSQVPLSQLSHWELWIEIMHGFVIIRWILPVWEWITEAAVILFWCFWSCSDTFSILPGIPFTLYGVREQNRDELNVYLRSGCGYTRLGVGGLADIKMFS